MLQSQRYIIGNILARCSLRDQFRAKRVCRKWNTYIDISTWPDQYALLTGRPFPWIMYMLYKYPDKEWDFECISKNPLICLDELLALYPNLTTNWPFELAENPTVTWKDIITHELDPAGYVFNPNLTADMIVNPPSVCFRSYYVVVHNPSIYWEDVMRLYPDDPVAWEEFSSNRNLTIPVLTSNPDINWNWDEISTNKNITWDFVYANLDKNWDWCLLSRNPIVTWDIVQQHPELPWRYDWLSSNRNITWELIQANKILQTDPAWISRNPNITIDIVFAHPDWPWDWSGLSLNQSITWADVVANMDKPWDFGDLSLKKK